VSVSQGHPALHSSLSRLRHVLKKTVGCYECAVGRFDALKTFLGCFEQSPKTNAGFQQLAAATALGPF
jgi:hypothetical protein